MCALTACKDGDESKPDAGEKAAPATQAGDRLGKRCEQLGKACGAKDKHEEKITGECKAAAKAQADKGCTDKVVALYDCYEKEICEPVNKVWAMDDFRVLVDRHKKCEAERKASDECVGDAK